MSSKPVAQPKIAPTVLADAEYERKWAEESQYQMLRRSHDPRFGEIIIYKKRGTNELVFAKEKLTTSKQAAAADIRELKSRMALNRPGLQKMIGYSTSIKKELCSTSYLTQGFYEFPRSDLGKEISNRVQSAGNFNEQELTSIAQNSLNGLNSLHQERISHGDIRPQYIGISHATNQAEILDRLADPAPLEKVQTGHIVNKKNLYMSPELYKKLQGKNKLIKYDPAKNDLYGLGLSILEAGTGHNVQDIYNANGTINQANLDKHVDVFNKKYPNSYLSQLVGGTLAQNESARLSTAELVSRLGSASVGGGAFGGQTQFDQYAYSSSQGGQAQFSGASGFGGAQGGQAVTTTTTTTTNQIVGGPQASTVATNQIIGTGASFNNQGGYSSAYDFNAQNNQSNYPQFSSTITQGALPSAPAQANLSVNNQSQAGQGLFDFTAKDAEVFENYSYKVNQSQSTLPSFLQDQQTNAYFAEKPVSKEFHLSAQPRAIKAQATYETQFVEKPVNTSTNTQSTFQNQSIPQQQNQSFSSQANVQAQPQAQTQVQAQPQAQAQVTVSNASQPTQTISQSYSYQAPLSTPQKYTAPAVQTSYTTQASNQPITTSYTSQPLTTSTYTSQYIPANQSYTIPTNQSSQSYIIQPSAPAVSTTQTYTLPANQPITISSSPITTTYTSQPFEAQSNTLQRVSYVNSSPSTQGSLIAPAPIQTTYLSSYPTQYVSGGVITNELPTYVQGSTRIFNAPISTEALPVVSAPSTIRPLTPVNLPASQTYTTYTTQSAVRPLTPQITTSYTAAPSTIRPMTPSITYAAQPVFSNAPATVTISPAYAQSERLVTTIGSTGSSALTGYYQPGAIFSGSQTNILPATTEIKSRKSVSFIDHEPSKIDYNNIIKTSNSGNYVSQSAQVINLPSTTIQSTQPTISKGTISWEEFQALKKNDQSIQLKEATQPVSYTTSYSSTIAPTTEYQTKYIQPATEHIVSQGADHQYTQSTHYDNPSDNHYAQTIHYDDHQNNAQYIQNDHQNNAQYSQNDHQNLQYSQNDNQGAQQHYDHDNYESGSYRVAAQNNGNWESNLAGNTATFSFSKQADQGNTPNYDSQSNVTTSFKRSTKRYKYVNGKMVEAYEDGVSRL